MLCNVTCSKCSELKRMFCRLYARLMFVAPTKHSCMYTRAPLYPFAVFCWKVLPLNRVIPPSRYTAPPPPSDVRLAAFDRNVLLVKLVWDRMVAPRPAMYTAPPMAALQQVSSNSQHCSWSSRHAHFQITSCSLSTTSVRDCMGTRYMSDRKCLYPLPKYVVAVNWIADELSADRAPPAANA